MKPGIDTISMVLAVVVGAIACGEIIITAVKYHVPWMVQIVDGHWVDADLQAGDNVSVQAIQDDVLVRNSVGGE